VSEGRLAAGFKCPVCHGEDANLLGMNLPQLELECLVCGWRFAVEATA
jgi:transcription elongation factor Elf1